MGRISEYIIELGEQFQDLLWHTGEWQAAKRLLKSEISSDEYEFFEAHEDIISQNLKDNPDQSSNDEIEMKPIDKRWKVVDIKTGELIASNLVKRIAQKLSYKKSSWTATPDSSNLDEEYIMSSLNEDWGMAQEALLIIAAGAAAIGIISGKNSKEELSWKDWIQNKLDFIPRFKRGRIRRESKVGLQDYAAEKIDLEALEEIINQNPAVKNSIERMKKGDNKHIMHYIILLNH